MGTMDNWDPSTGVFGPSIFDEMALQNPNGYAPFGPYGPYILPTGRISVKNDLITNAELKRYKLLFVGELMQMQFTKSPMSRAAVLQCQDLSNYWDYAFQFNNTDIFGPGMKAMFSGGSTNLFTDFLSDPGSQVVGILFKPPTRYPNMQGLLGGIIHLLEAMGGSYYYGNKYAGQNVFFSLAELRLRITQMITAYDKDSTVKKLLGGGYDSLFGRSIGNLGEQASYRKIISMLTGVIFHEVYGQPCPLYEPAAAGSQDGYVRKSIRDLGGVGDLAFTADTVGAGLAEVRRLFTAFSDEAPPKVDSNAVDTAKAIGLDTNKYKQAVARQVVKRRTTELSKQKLTLQNYQRACTKAGSSAKMMSNEYKRLGIPDVAEMCTRVAANFTLANNNIIAGINLLSNISVATKDSPIQQRFFQALQTAEEALAVIGREEGAVTNKKDAKPASLKQQIFRPDVWFSAPIRCNVLFPSHIMQMSYSNNFMAAPTRLMLKTNDEFFGEDELFDKFYFAPKVPGLKGQDANLWKVLLKNDIFDHELYTGIIPVFEKMGEFNIFAARTGLQDGKQPKVGLAQRSANFLYFKYRFASRQLSITSRFNPYIACGFPGLVIDKHVDLGGIKRFNDQLAAQGVPTRDASAMLGRHFLASFTQVTHNISQMEGTTTIECSYARTTNERTEFLGAIQDRVEVLKKKGKVVVDTTTVAALTPPKLDQLGPLLGRIIDVVDVTDRYVEAPADPENSPAFLLYGGPRNKKTKALELTVPVGVTQTAGSYGKGVVEFAGDPALVLTFRAYLVTEEVPQTEKELIDLEPEEYIRPGWYGDCWHPSRISDVYKDFFRIGAITEATQVQGGNLSADAGLVTNDPITALADAVENGNISAAQDTLILLSQTKNASIEQAVAFLVLTYSIIKNGGFDIGDFIREYTWRPIASMLDIFGSVDLEYDENGEEVVHGEEGFHSRAFGPYNNLFGLLAQNLESVVGVKRGSPIAQKLDVRKNKQDAILKYVATLKPGTVILG